MTGHVYKKKRPPVAGGGEEECHVIMNEGDGSSSMTSESDHGAESHPPRILHGQSVREYMDTMLHSTKAQVLIVGLSILNCLIVIVELLIYLRVFELERRNNAFATALHYVSIGKSPLLSASHLFSWLVLGYDAFLLSLMMVLSLFVLEMGGKLVAMDVRFFKHKMEVFDCVVVLLTFALTLALGGHESSADGFGLLIMLRLWRIAKILKSMIESVRKEAERKMGKERRARRALEREVSKLREYCLQQEVELQMYRIMLQQNNIPEPTVLRPPPAPRTLSVIAEVNEHDSFSNSNSGSAPNSNSEDSEHSLNEGTD